MSEGREGEKTAKFKILLEYAKGQIMLNNLSNFMRYKYDDSHVMTSLSPGTGGVPGHLDNGAEDGNRMKRIVQGDSRITGSFLVLHKRDYYIGFQRNLDISIKILILTGLCIQPFSFAWD